MSVEADDTVLRWSPTKKVKKELKSHAVVRDYNYHFNGVDHKDRDMADWTISMKSNKFYFRIFYWNFDSVIHCAHNVVKDVVEIAKQAAKQAAETVVDFWTRYTEPILGRYHFQMDAGIALINKGLTMDWDWDNPTKVECRPKYVRHIDWEPCDCPDDDSKQLRCFFCRNGFTHGIAHKDENRKRNKPSTARGVCTAERVNLGYPGKCFICMNELIAAGMTKGEAKKKARSSRLGCGKCEGQKKFCCEQHWNQHGV